MVKFGICAICPYVCQEPLISLLFLKLGSHQVQSWKQNKDLRLWGLCCEDFEHRTNCQLIISWSDRVSIWFRPCSIQYQKMEFVDFCSSLFILWFRINTLRPLVSLSLRVNVKTTTTSMLMMYQHLELFYQQLETLNVLKSPTWRCHKRHCNRNDFWKTVIVVTVMLVTSLC